MRGIKSIVRDLLPRGAQVPIKYHYARLRGELEPEMALLGSLVSRGDRVIDVGGNRGVYVYSLDRLGARVEVFEPNPVCLRVLRPWADRHPAVAIHAFGLSNASGTAELAIPVDQCGTEHDASASIEHGGGPDSRLETIAIRTLDSFDIRDAVLIKIDVEGHEQSVVEGGLYTIAASAPALLIEIEQRHLDKPIGEVFQRIEALGYRGYFLKDGKLKSLSDFSVEVHQSIANFGSHTGNYYNNFIFLSEGKLGDGTYASLVDP